ncbi:PKD domain-containing protein [Enterococcus mundtii]|uniref:PKD domain-containing protein n=1 Tax=Enterococcus mundtii TaxID=53346 RepID=UPI00280BB3C3|nr:PKD domain-containing protein [Enterococcus mundtii]
MTFRNTSSLNTETVTWEFEGGDITISHENSPVVTYDKEGVYKVKLTASNQAWENRCTFCNDFCPRWEFTEV